MQDWILRIALVANSVIMLTAFVGGSYIAPGQWEEKTAKDETSTDNDAQSTGSAGILLISCEAILPALQLFLSSSSLTIIEKIFVIVQSDPKGSVGEITTDLVCHSIFGKAICPNAP